MSNFSYVGKNFEISRAQAIQAIGARTKITPLQNPILLKPLGNYRSSVFVNGKFFKKMHATDYYENFVLKDGLKKSMSSFNKLSESHEIIFLEGAGSPAEINLQKYDITNMKMAKKTKSPVLLVADIERGGSFASIVGTMELIEKKYVELVQGFIINKFRGDIEILKPGYKKLQQKTRLPVFGTIPMTKFNIPDEDSIGNSSKNLNWNSSNIKKLDKEINKIAKVVKSSLNIRNVEKLLK